jgi:hypothetical protein
MPRRDVTAVSCPPTVRMKVVIDDYAFQYGQFCRLGAILTGCHRLADLLAQWWTD